MLTIPFQDLEITGLSKENNNTIVTVIEIKMSLMKSLARLELEGLDKKLNTKSENLKRNRPLRTNLKHKDHHKIVWIPR